MKEEGREGEIEISSRKGQEFILQLLVGVVML